jgi:hypothetical protein
MHLALETGAARNEEPNREYGNCARSEAVDSLPYSETQGSSLASLLNHLIVSHLSDTDTQKKQTDAADSQTGKTQIAAALFCKSAVSGAPAPEGATWVRALGRLRCITVQGHGENLMYRKNKNPFQKEKRTGGHILGLMGLMTQTVASCVATAQKSTTTCASIITVVRDSAARLCNGEYECADAREATSEIRAKNR